MERMSRRAAAAALAAAIALPVATAPPSAASPYLRDFSVVSGSSPMNSSTRKTVDVSCGVGTFTLGEAAFVSPALGNLGLTSGTSAVETDDVPGAWRLNVRAFCARSTGPPPKNGAASYLKAVQIARGQSAGDSQSAKSATATCPAGKTAISGGGRIAPPNVDVAFTAMQRASAGSAWRVAAHEVDPTGAVWTLHATALCANVTTETAINEYADRLSITGGGSPASSMPLQTSAVTCPAGQAVFGGRAGVGGAAAGQLPPRDVVLTSSEPTPGGWLVTGYETDPTNQAWGLGRAVGCSPFNGGPPA